MKRKTMTAILLALTVTAMAQRMTDGATHSPYVLAVDEYRPAPGQFVNTTPEATVSDTPATMAQKCTAVLKHNADRIANGLDPDENTGDGDYNTSHLITLGAYGGSITFHFDHSIANVAGQKDLLIQGNAIKSQWTDKGGGCEPGIVMVSRDENGNGLPDDTWYELAGSADTDSLGKVVYDYQITYTFAPMKNIPWTDNKGGSGYVYRNGWHKQEYFPLWLGSELTYSGTRLPNNTTDLYGSGNTWIGYFLRYGYVDNKPNTDADANSFDLSWAVDPLTRQSVNLDFVDFVRVYTAVNCHMGINGESSTEIQHAEDLHLDASIAAIREATAGISTLRGHEPATVVGSYTLDGLRVGEQVMPAEHHGIRIQRMSDGTIRKVFIK